MALNSLPSRARHVARPDPGRHRAQSRPRWRNPTADRTKLIAHLEARFRYLSELLYDTSVAPARVDAELAPLLAEDVLFTYPLRTILLYDFRVTAPQGPEPGIVISAHEEMWSIADMVAALPVTGWVYRHAFRPAFSRGFLAKSWLAARARGVLPDFRAP